jgi:hypothetical protein
MIQKKRDIINGRIIDCAKISTSTSAVIERKI